MRRRLVCLALIAQGLAALAAPAAAGDAVAIPSFVEETASAGIDSSYDGEWEYMVGGGVATFDCNGDHFDDMFLAGGTWLAITRTGRFAAVTNLRDAPRPDAPSRGKLVAQFLLGDATPADYVDGVAARAAQFAGFHLIAGVVGDEIGYVTNAPGAEGGRLYANGVHGVSNGPPQERWVKVIDGEASASTRRTSSRSMVKSARRSPTATAVPVMRAIWLWSA